MQHSERTKQRRVAVGAVATALTRFSDGRALAGQLEDALAGHGVSLRQARRWMGWAVAADVVTKTAKGAAGTWYCLPGREPTQSAHMPAEAPLALPVSGLACVPRDRRRDVALSLLALLGTGGEMEARELARAVAERAGRPLLWGVVAVDGASGAARRVMRYRWNGPETVYYLAADLDEDALEAWAALPAFRLPGEACALERHLRRSLGAPELAVTAAEAEVLARIASLGGAATADELLEAPYTDRRAAFALISGARDEPPAWLVSEGGRRFRLAAALWT